MRDWTKEFNDLPEGIREILIKVSLEDQINYLKREKLRLKKRYVQSCLEVNGLIKNLEKELER